MRHDIRNLLLLAAASAAPLIGTGCMTLPDEGYAANYPPPPVYQNGRWIDTPSDAQFRADRQQTPAERTPAPGSLTDPAQYASGAGGGGANPGSDPAGRGPANGNSNAGDPNDPKNALGAPPIADTTGVRFAELPAVKRAVDSAQSLQQAEQQAAAKIDGDDLRQNLHDGMAALAPRIARALVDRKGDVAVVTVAVYREPTGGGANAAPNANAGNPNFVGPTPGNPTTGPAAADVALDGKPINPLLRTTPETVPAAGGIAHDDQPPATITPADASAKDGSPKRGPAGADGNSRDVAIAIAFEGFGKALEGSYLPRVLSDQPRPPDDGQDVGPDDGKAADPKAAGGKPGDAGAARPATGPAARGDNRVLDAAAPSYIVYQLGPNGLVAGVVGHDELRGQVATAVQNLPPRQPGEARPQDGRPPQDGVAQGPTSDDNHPGPGATYRPSDVPPGYSQNDPTQGQYSQGNQPGAGAQYVPAPDYNGGGGPVGPAYDPSYYEPPAGGYAYDPYSYGPTYYGPSYGYGTVYYPPTYWGPADDPFLCDLYGSRWGSRYFFASTGYYYGSPWYYSRRHGWNHRPDRDYNHDRPPSNGNGGGAVAGRRPARSEVPWARPPVVSPTLPTLASSNGRVGYAAARSANGRSVDGRNGDARTSLDAQAREQQNLQRAAVARTLAADRVASAARANALKANAGRGNVAASSANGSPSNRFGTDAGRANGGTAARAGAGARPNGATPLDIPARPGGGATYVPADRATPAAGRNSAAGDPVRSDAARAARAADASRNDAGRNNGARDSGSPAARPPGYGGSTANPANDRSAANARSADRAPNDGRVTYKQVGGSTVTYIPQTAGKSEGDDDGTPNGVSRLPSAAARGSSGAAAVRPQATPQNNGGNRNNGGSDTPRFQPSPQLDDVPRAMQDSSGGSSRGGVTSSPRSSGGGDDAGSRRASPFTRGDMGNGNRGDSGPRFDPGPARGNTGGGSAADRGGPSPSASRAPSGGGNDGGGRAAPSARSSDNSGGGGNGGGGRSSGGGDSGGGGGGGRSSGGGGGGGGRGR